MVGGYGPSMAMLNKVFVMSCDALLIPTLVDRLHYNAAHFLMHTIMPSWLQWYHDTVKKQQEILHRMDQERKSIYQSYAFTHHAPQLLPVMVIRYAVVGETIQNQHSLEKSLLQDDLSMHMCMNNSMWFDAIHDIVNEAPRIITWVDLTNDQQRVIPLCPNTECSWLRQQSNDNLADETFTLSRSRFVNLARRLAAWLFLNDIDKNES